MATTITPADLTVKITETITLDGRSLGGSSTVTRSSTNQIGDVFSRIVSVPSGAETSLFTTSASASGGSMVDYDNVRYMRVTNKDGANSVDLIIADTADDESGLALGPGESFVLWGFQSMLEGAGGECTVTVGVIGDSATMVAAAGTTANGATDGQYLQLIDTEGITKNYVITDTALDGEATGEELSISSDIGSDTLGALTSLTEGVAVGRITASTQHDVLLQLKSAIEGSTGHNGSIVVGVVPATGAGAITTTLEQAVTGAAGNTTTTTSITNITSADFSGGVSGIVTGKVHIASIIAIANSANVDVEIFIASKK